MAVPKRKTSCSKRDMRRSHHRVGSPALTKCSHCGETKLAFHVCQACGYYKGRAVLLRPSEEEEKVDDASA